MRKGFSVPKLVVFTLLAVWFVLQIYPLFFMIISAFKTESEIVANPLGLPSSFRLDSFIAAWNGRTEAVEFSQYFVNSMLLTALSLLLLCASALLAGYALARLDFPGRMLVYSLVVCMITIPTQALIVPLYDAYEKLHLTNNILAMIPLYAAFSLPFSIFIMKTNIEAIPKELEEAARMDGCGQLKTFWNIIVPMSKNSIVTIAVVNLTTVWSELMYATVFLVLPESRTLPIVVSLFKPNSYSISTSTLMAALTFATLPLLLAYFLFQKQIVKGLSAGAIK